MKPCLYVLPQNRAHAPDIVIAIMSNRRAYPIIRLNEPATLLEFQAGVRKYLDMIQRKLWAASVYSRLDNRALADEMRLYVDDFCDNLARGRVRTASASAVGVKRQRKRDGDE